MPASVTALSLAAARAAPQAAGSATVFVALMLLALSYIAWRAGWLRNRPGGGRLRALRADLRDLRVSPLALVPTLVLVVVLVLLLVVR